MLQLARVRRTGALGVVALALVCCGGEASAPTVSTGFLVIHLEPAEGDLAWELDEDLRSVRLSPELSWEVQFVSSVGVTYQGADVMVRLLDETQAKICFESRVDVTSFSEGLAYHVSGSSFRLTREAWLDKDPPQNPCGEDFTVGAVDVALRFPAFGPALLSRRMPCSYRLSRAGVR